MRLWRGFGQGTYEVFVRGLRSRFRDARGVQGRSARRAVAQSLRTARALGPQRPKALSKAEIHKALWPDTFVTETNLANLVVELRAALGDDAQSQRIVRTLPRFGYAFCAEVTPTAGTAGSRIRRGPPVPPRLASPPDRALTRGKPHRARPFGGRLDQRRVRFPAPCPDRHRRDRGDTGRPREQERHVLGGRRSPGRLASRTATRSRSEKWSPRCAFTASKHRPARPVGKKKRLERIIPQRPVRERKSAPANNLTGRSGPRRAP